MADNKISSSKKEIYTKLLDIAAKYTDDNLKETDFLKTGLFGYVTESMAMMMRDSTIHKSMIYNENTLNTAIIPKTVYNWAKMFNIEIQKATPAYADIDIIIPANSLLSSFKLQPTTTEVERYGISPSISNFIILNKEDPIIAGDYYFSLEHSILIRQVNNIADQFVASYILTEYESTNYQKLNSGFLTLKNDGTNVIIKARAYQYRRYVYDRQISTNSFLNKMQKYTFTGKFCGAKLFYEEAGDETEVTLQYSDLATTASSKVAFYNLNNENELVLIFKTGEEYFIPSSSAKLRLYLYTTNGEDIPSIYSGDALMMISDNDIKNLPIVINFNPTNIIGGKNPPTLNEIKQAIINEISTRNTITTKSDLDKYFSVLMSLVEDINNGKVIFRKNRDDVIRRIYNAYLLIRDNTNETTGETAASSYISPCVPTNTIDVSLKLEKSGQYTTNMKDSRYRLFNINGEEINEASADNDFYISPFLIFIFNSASTSSSVNFVKYIYNLTNDVSGLSYSDETDEVINSNFNKSYYIIPEGVSIFRGFSDSANMYKAANSYIITLKTTTNFILGQLTDDSTVAALTPSGNITIEGKNSVLTVSNSDITCQSTKISDGVYSTEIKLTIPVKVDNEFDMLGVDTLATEASLCSQINIGDSGVKFNSSERFKFDLTNFSVNGISTGLVLEADNSLVLYQQMDNIIESAPIITEIEVNNEDGTKETLQKITGLKEVPVIHSSFFKNATYLTTRKENFIKQLFAYIKLLKSNLEKLETSTFFNLKFFNSYGYSHFYNTPNTNVKLNLLITLIPEYQIGYQDLKAEIRSYIRRLIDKMNDTNSGIKISTIIGMIMKAETYGAYIDHVEFIGLNDTFNQYIEPISDMSQKEILQYPPEWLNLDADSIDELILFENDK